MPKPRIGYVTTFSAAPKTIDSALLGVQGAATSIAQALKKRGLELEYLSPLETRIPLWAKLRMRIEDRCLGARWFPWLSRSLHRDYARQLERKLAETPCDVLLSPQNIWPLAGLNSSRRFVLWTDAPLGLQLNTWGFWKNVPPRTVRQVYQLERETFERCEAVFVASTWARERTIELYQVSPSRIHTLPWCANLPAAPLPEEVLEWSGSRAKTDPWDFLFIGVDWRRKGLDTAVKLVDTLNDRGISCRLQAVGPVGTGLPESPYVDYHGLISSHTLDGWIRLRQLLVRCHALLLPSRAENLGQVLCEANAFGLPCLASRIQGIPEVIRDGVNGYCAEPDELDDWIEKARELRENYTSLSAGAYHEYRDRLNWDSAVTQLCETLKWS